MKLKAEQLSTSLTKNLLPVYFVSGDETLLVQEAVDSIRQAAAAQGFDERKVHDVDKQFDWNVLLEDANALSLFAEKKITELRLGKAKPGTPGSKALQAYCEQQVEDSILIIEAAKMDSASLKSKWAQAIDRVGAIIQVWPVSLEQIPRWLAQRAQKLKLNLDRDAIALLSDRLEGNLLAAQQELEKLKLLHGNAAIDAAMIEENVGDSARYDVFDLTDACLKADAKQTIKINSHLKMEGVEPSFVLWALGKELRILYALSMAERQQIPPQSIFKQFRVFPKRQQLLLAASRRHSTGRLQQLLELTKQTDDRIKGVIARSSPWETLDDLALGLCGVAY